MSAWELTEPISASPAESPAETRPNLSSLPGLASRPSGIPFVGVVVLLLALGMVGLLGLNTYLQDQAFQLRKAQQQAAALVYRASDLQGQVNRANAPGAVAQQATALGMVPNPYSVFIDLKGKVVGKPKVVTGHEIDSLKVQPKATPSAQASATTPVQTNVQPWIDLGQGTLPSAQPAAPASAKPATAPAKPATAPAVKTP
jgi:hypothetical protein